MKQKKETSQIEMVETHNLALSLRRLANCTPYSSRRLPRALYHALLMAADLTSAQLSRIREALDLP